MGNDEVSRGHAAAIRQSQSQRYTTADFYIVLNLSLAAEVQPQACWKLGIIMHRALKKIYMFVIWPMLM